MNNSLWLDLIEKNNITPNFLCSLEYFQKSDWKEASDGDYVGVYDVDDLPTLPLINIKKGILHQHVPPLGIWADVPGFEPYEFVNKSFWDYQFIYNSLNFQNMNGKQWSVFRKNSRKFFRNNQQMDIIETKIGSIDQLEDFSYQAIETIKDNSIHDIDTMINFLMNGRHRQFIIDKSKKKLLAVNIWDENYKYINYRYCLCLDLPYLSEFARIKFYKFIALIRPGKLVNDGGVLGRQSLKSFKDKMNPVEIRKIYTWK